MIEFDAVAVAVETERPDGGRVRQHILEPTTLRLSERRIAIIGANGSGKSTLARLVNGLATPTEGAVRVDGMDAHRNGREVRRRVGFCFSDPAAQLVMPTAVEDVALSLRRRHRRGDERTDAAIALLRDFGLGGLEHRSVHDLSGGQRQLLALVSVLAAEPSIVVADEPTTLLDLRNARAIGDRLMSLDQQLLLVTHDLELAIRCERAIRLDHGRVVDDGAPAGVVDRYRRTAAPAIS